MIWAFIFGSLPFELFMWQCWSTRNCWLLKFIVFLLFSSFRSENNLRIFIKFWRVYLPSSTLKLYRCRDWQISIALSPCFKRNLWRFCWRVPARYSWLSASTSRQIFSLLCPPRRCSGGHSWVLSRRCRCWVRLQQAETAISYDIPFIDFWCGRWWVVRGLWLWVCWRCLLVFSVWFGCLCWVWVDSWSKNLAVGTYIYFQNWYVWWLLVLGKEKEQ